MKKLTKRLGTGVMAVSIVLSSAMVAFAEDPAPAGTGTFGGTGGIEGIVKTDVYTADFPTDSNDAYNYIADPQGLIRKTNAAKYGDKTFGDGTVFFTNKEGDYNYSNASDAVTIVNQSSKNLSVIVKAKATPGTDGATLATSKTFSGTSKEVYLGITDSVEGSTEQALTAAGVEMKAVLGAAPEEAYEYSYNSDTNKYEYTLKSDVSAFNFAEYSFQINGAANDKATDWADATALPAIEVTWTVDLTDDTPTVATPEQKPAEEPAIALSGTYSRANTANVFELTGLGTATITKIEGLNAEGDVFAEITSNMYTLEGSSLKVNGTTAPWGAGAVGATRGIKVTLDNGTEIQTTFTVNR